MKKSTLKLRLAAVAPIIQHQASRQEYLADMRMFVRCADVHTKIRAATVGEVDGSLLPHIPVLTDIRMNCSRTLLLCEPRGVV